MWKLSSSLWLFLVAARRITAANPSCERLKRSLTYTQEEAPRDLSGVVSGFGNPFMWYGGTCENAYCLGTGSLRVCKF